MTELDDIAWVLRGRQRRKVILALSKRKTPTLIKEETEMSLNNVSDILRLFVKKGLAVCLNPKEKAGRLYCLTKNGEAIKEELERLK